MRATPTTEVPGVNGKGQRVKPSKLRAGKIKRAAKRNAAGNAVNANGSGESPLLTLTEAAYRLGRVHRTTIMRWVKEGRLRCVRLSRKAILFEAAEITRFIQEHRYSGH